MPNAVILDPTREALRDRLITAGRFGSPQEGIAAGVALRLQHEDRLATMPEAWRKGIESGDDEPLDVRPDALGARYAAMEKAGP
ncbi:MULTISPECIES: type II toxin-antitoxin system ParD family antitoxin [unclassified Methylobacterium]|uniref:type II toxin-antitoxin system ParD family antitoxin n=1 Tax=unclassified Methylobacterium TaxID=2615210 RepID=UPI0011C1F723|nr:MULTISPECIES: type II toxin-antitoxin system ParD family antitoxin [unclassified Methylobacterium]QEE38315.1 type II toxin-antitoxin system ParD family antitoxin [Methylobacterium sp. WL1]TXM97777.1 type II toxin-antitoxin system ParD family antitoxin [Methylobacterium sp. WL64]TXN57472.1 type II toxin-antitoxin system ParD family antitoxin [Methylobacterium sp. WL2]